MSNYVLRAVIVHRGNTLHAGHYVTYRYWKKATIETESEGNAWVLTSDESINLVNFSSVQNCQAYMIFYEPKQVFTEDEIQPKDSEMVNNEDSDNWDADQLQYLIRNIDRIASPSRRIRVLMAVASGICDVA